MIRLVTVLDGSDGRGRRDIELKLTEAATIGDVEQALGVPIREFEPTSLAHRLRSGTVLAGDPAVERPPAGTVLALVTTGPATGTIFHLEPGAHSLGRSAEADLTLSDPTVSSRHAEVKVDERGRVTVRDLGSTNGTWVDGHRATQPADVGSSTILRVGDATMAFHRFDDPDGVVRAGADGRQLFNLTPRWTDRPLNFVASAPVRPEPAEPMGLGPNLAMAALTAGGSVAMAAMTGRWEWMLMGALSPAQFVLTNALSRRGQRRRNARDLAAYEAALADVHRRHKEAMAQERSALARALPSPIEVLDIATGPSSRLWERQPSDEDFLRLRIGVGSRRALAQVSREDPSDASDLVDAPVGVDLNVDRVVGLHGDAAAVAGVARWVVAQAAALHAPVRLRLVFLGTEASEPDWGWLRFLPHVRRDGVYDLATDDSGTSRILKELVQRIDLMAASAAFTADPAPVHTLLVVDQVDRLNHDPLLARVLEAGPMVGVATLALADSRPRQRGECSATAAVAADGALELDGSGLHDIRDAVAEGIGSNMADAIARGMAWLTVAVPGAGAELPHPLPLGEVEPWPSPDVLASRWEDVPASSRFAIGVEEGGLMELDLVTDGPHFLFAGTAGSGKSQLVRAALASMAIRNRPDHLNFALFDFKGGACFGAATELPHATSLTLNLESSADIARSVSLLSAEIRRREDRFRETGVDDLATYWRRRGADAPMLARLVVVIDEFAAFVKALPKVIDPLVDIGRRGRSLGVHLLLATQSPRECVTPELRANVQTRLALRTADEAESALIIGSPEASMIAGSKLGRGFVATASDGALHQFQSAWPDAPVDIGAEPPVLVRDLDWRVISRPAPGAGPPDPKSRKHLDELVAAARTAWAGLEADHGPLATPVPPPLPAQLAPRLPSQRDGRGRRVELALEDATAKQAQPWVELDLDDGGCIVVAGGPGSGRTAALRAAVNSALEQFGRADCHIHAIDLAAGQLASLEGLAPVGTVVLPGEEGRCRALLQKLDRLVTERSAALASANAPRWQDLPSSDRPPAVLLVVDGWTPVSRFLADDAGGRAAMTRVLEKGPRVGITALVTSDAGPEDRDLLPYAAERFVLRLNDESRYGRLGVEPADVPNDEMPPGRAIRVSSGNRVQVVWVEDWPTPPESDGPEPIQIPRLPLRVEANELARQDAALSVSVGLEGGTGDTAVVDLAEQGPAVLVTGPPRSGRTTTLRLIAESLLAAGAQVVVVAGRRSPLRLDPPVGAVTVDASGLAAAVEGLDGGRPAVLVSDDVGERFFDEPATAAFLVPPLRSWVAAERWEEARLIRSSSAFGTAARSCATAVLLQPPRGSSMPVVGVDVPRNVDVAEVPGRGWLLRDGEVCVVQIAVPTRPSERTVVR